MQLVIDSIDDSLLDDCAQNIAGRAWVTSRGESVHFCGGDMSRDEWVKHMAGDQYPRDLFELGGLMKQRSANGTLYNCFTLLPHNFYGERCRSETRPGGS